MFIFPVCFFKPKEVVVTPTPRPTGTPTEGFDEMDFLLFGDYWTANNVDFLAIDKLIGYPKVIAATPTESSVDYFEAILFEIDFISEDLDPLVLEEYTLDVSSKLVEDDLEKLLFDSYGVDDNFGTLD